MAAMAKKPTCSEPGCGKQFRTILLLRNHLVNDHGLNHPELEFIFQTEEELLAWKQSYESDNFVFSRRGRRVYEKDGHHHITFNCNRCYKAGHSALSGKRRAIGSVIMDVFCTCLFVAYYMENEIKVKLFSSHYNHDLVKSHKQFLSMSKSERLQIEEQLEIGIIFRYQLAHTYNK